MSDTSSRIQVRNDVWLLRAGVTSDFDWTPARLLLSSFGGQAPGYAGDVPPFLPRVAAVFLLPPPHLGTLSPKALLLLPPPTPLPIKVWSQETLGHQSPSECASVFYSVKSTARVGVRPVARGGQAWLFGPPEVAQAEMQPLPLLCTWAGTCPALPGVPGVLAVTLGWHLTHLATELERGEENYWCWGTNTIWEGRDFGCWQICRSDFYWRDSLTQYSPCFERLLSCAQIMGMSQNSSVSCWAAVVYTDQFWSVYTSVLMALCSLSWAWFYNSHKIIIYQICT